MKLFLIVMVIGFFIVFLWGCAPPPISELLKDGVNCKASITMPESGDYAEGETVDVKVKIYECREVVP